MHLASFGSKLWNRSGKVRDLWGQTWSFCASGCQMPASSPEWSCCAGGRVQSSEILGLGCCLSLSSAAFPSGSFCPKYACFPMVVGIHLWGSAGNLWEMCSINQLTMDFYFSAWKHRNVFSRTNYYIRSFSFSFLSLSRPGTKCCRESHAINVVVVWTPK